MKNKGRRRTIIFSGTGLSLLFILYRLIPDTPAQSVLTYMVVFLVAFLLVVSTFLFLRRNEWEPLDLFLVLFFTALLSFILLPAYPHQSDDIFRYIWDGKLQAFGINPYRFAPDDPSLTAYHSDKLPALINFPHIKTIYPPFAQLFFTLSYHLFGESVAGLKCLFILFLLASVYLFDGIVRMTSMDRRLTLFFAWNPLIIMETAVNGHLDIVMLFFLLLSLLLYMKNRLALSGISLGISILTKLIPVVVIPIFLFHLLRDKEKMRSVVRFFAPLLITLFSFYLVYIKSAQNMFLTALNYSSKWYFNNPIFHGLLLIFKTNALSHLIAYMMFSVVLLVVLFSPLRFEKKIFYTFFSFVLLNPTVHPWYLVVILGLLAITCHEFTILWSGSVVVSYFVVHNYKLSGIWQDSWLFMGIEYFPLALFMLLRVVLKKKSLLFCDR